MFSELGLTLQLGSRIEGFQVCGKDLGLKAFKEEAPIHF